MQTSHPNFNQDISSYWRSLTPTNPGAHLTLKLRSLYWFLKRWVKSQFRNILREKCEISFSIGAIDDTFDNQLLTLARWQDWSSLLLELDKIQKLEEIIWKQKWKTHWLKKGDSNTKYFHCIANLRRYKNHIPLIKDGETIHQSQPEILNIFTRYYHFLYGKTSTSPDIIQANWELLYSLPTIYSLPTLNNPSLKKK